MDKLYFIGDHHNVWEDFETEIVVKGIRDAIIIHLGDGGFGTVAPRIGSYPRKYFLKKYMKQNDFLEARNITWYNIRGNHDNPHWFMPKEKMVKFFRDEDKKVAAWIKESVYYIMDYMSPMEFTDAITNIPRIKFVEDYTVLELLGQRILCVGGAITVDRMVRKQGCDYFKNEVLKRKPKLLAAIKGVNIVATHTAPDFIPPFHQKGKAVETFRKHDTNLVAELIAERQVMTTIYRDVVKHNKPAWWFYGHFHEPNKTLYEDTTFICVAPNKTYRFPIE